MGPFRSLETDKIPLETLAFPRQSPQTVVNINRYLMAGNSLGGLGPNFAMLIFRLSIGLSLAIAHGMKKIPPPQGFIDAVNLLGFPLPGLFAWAAGLSEFIGSLMIAAGLLTRASSFFVFFTMAVACFGQHAADPFKERELSFLYASAAFLIMFVGSGSFGMDALINKGGKSTKR